MWASLVLNVGRNRIAEWMTNDKSHPTMYERLDSEMPRLAAYLEKTDGACMKSARVGVTQFRNRHKSHD